MRTKTRMTVHNLPAKVDHVPVLIGIAVLVYGPTDSCATDMVYYEVEAHDVVFSCNDADGVLARQRIKPELNLSILDRPLDVVPTSISWSTRGNGIRFDFRAFAYGKSLDGSHILKRWQEEITARSEGAGKVSARENELLTERNRIDAELDLLRKQRVEAGKAFKVTKFTVEHVAGGFD